MASKEASLTDLNAAVGRLNEQVSNLSAQLEEAKSRVTSQKLELTKLLDQIDARNKEIEKRDQEIARLRDFEKYRSEFLASLAHVFSGVSDIKVMGDRFVFEGEVLFDSGKADLRPDGKELLNRFIATYRSFESRIPKNVGLNIQIQGHTDTDPISTARFPSNWELSTARATEVVKYLNLQGVPPTVLSAAGYSEYYPAVSAKDEGAKRQNRRIEILFTRR
jgi:chemotaxis protein MotB